MQLAPVMEMECESRTMTEFTFQTDFFLFKYENVKSYYIYITYCIL